MDWSVFYLQSGRNGDWLTYLLQPHNEHRLPISRLLIAADIELFHGSGTPFFIVGAFTFLAILGVLVREISMSKLPTELCLAMIAVVTFCLAGTHLAVLISVPVLMVFLQTALFCILAIILLDAHDETRHPARRAVALACALLAPFSVSAGFMVWPVLLWVAWRGGLRLPWLLAIALTGTAEAIGYLPGISQVPHQPMTVTLISFLHMADYSIRLLGLPWSRLAALVWFGRLVGLLCLTVGGWLLVKISLQATPPSRLQRIGAALILLALLTAAAAGLVRSDVAPEGELPIRYSIFAVLAQIGILFAASNYLKLVYEKRIGRLLAPAMAALVVVLLLQQMVSGFVAVSVVQKFNFEWQRFSAGHWTPEMERYIYPSRERAEAALALFRNEDLYSIGP